MGADAKPNHTPECEARAQASLAALNAYLAKWGRTYCKACKGRGQFTSSFNPSAAGVSLGTGYMTDKEPCEECTEQGNCPRCGSGDGLTNNIVSVGEGPCLDCGWDYNDGGLPVEPECICPIEVQGWMELLPDEYLP